MLCPRLQTAQFSRWYHYLLSAPQLCLTFAASYSCGIHQLLLTTDVQLLKDQDKFFCSIDNFQPELKMNNQPQIIDTTSRRNCMKPFVGGWRSLSKRRTVIAN
jgi:hypothetical protein